MNAILLAAGFGSRLMPITKNMPKCMVKIGNEHLIDIWIKKLFKANIKKILINTHYLSEIVKRHIEANSFYKNNRIILKYEKELLGTAGTLIKNSNFFDNKDGMLLHADNFTTDDLKGFIEFHKRNIDGYSFSMMSFKTENPEKSGILKVNNNDLLTNFYEKDIRDFGNQANSATYILSNRMIKSIAKSKVKDFSSEIIPNYLNKIKVYKSKSFFIDIGDVRSLNKARNIINKYNDK